MCTGLIAEIAQSRQPPKRSFGYATSGLIADIAQSRAPFGYAAAGLTADMLNPVSATNRPFGYATAGLIAVLSHALAPRLLNTLAARLCLTAPQPCGFLATAILGCFSVPPRAIWVPDSPELKEE